MSVALGLCACFSIRKAADTTKISPTHSAQGWLSGASGLNKNYLAFGAWRGSPVTIAGVWSDATPDDQENQWTYNDYADFPESLDLAVGAFYGSETWSNAANGDLDARFKAALKKIDAGWGKKKTIYIRFAHEFNGDWYKWKVNKSNADAFRRAFRHFYRLVQEELVARGRDARVVWSPSDESHSDAPVEDMWPGDKFVDVIGVDSYDWDPTRDTQANWDRALNAVDKHGEPRGIEAWRKFAEAHGKPLAFPEWGCNPSTVVDDPFYIQKMNEYFRQHAGAGAGRVLYEIYFNVWPKDRIYPNSQIPHAQEMYRSLKWGCPNNPLNK